MFGSVTCLRDKFRWNRKLKYCCCLIWGALRICRFSACQTHQQPPYQVRENGTALISSHLPLSMISDNKWHHYFSSPRLVSLSHLISAYCWGRQCCRPALVSLRRFLPLRAGVRAVSPGRTAENRPPAHASSHERVPLVPASCVHVCVCAYMKKRVFVCLQRPPTGGQVLLMLKMTYNIVTSVLYMAKRHALACTWVCALLVCVFCVCWTSYKKHGFSHIPCSWLLWSNGMYLC